jgi:serine/alanine adding enzyme
VQSTAETTVRRLADSECAACNRYLAQRGPGYLFHRAEWDRVFAAYDLPTVRIAAFRQGQIVGILPLVWQRSLLFGKHLVSLPWFDAAGILADDDLAQRALLEEAARLADSYRVQIVQLRQLDKGVGNLSSEAPSGRFRQRVPDAYFQSEHLRTDKVLMRLALSPDPEIFWRGLLPKVRNQVRKAEKSGLVVSCGGAELLGEFYRIYSENMRDLGSPPHHRRFFHAVLANFEGESNIYVVRLNNETVGAGFTMANGGILEIPWASSLERFNQYCVNHLMYWRILESACRQGYAWFHFGRSSRGSGTYQFKKQWESKEIQSGSGESKETQLYWYYLSRGITTVPSSPTAQESYGWAVRIWQRLPLWLSNLLGPRIIAKLP